VRVSHDLGAEGLKLDAVRLGGSGSQQLLATDRFGRLTVLDGELRPVRQATPVQCAPREAELELQCMADLDKDGRPELILSACEMETRGPQSVTGQGNARTHFNIEVLALSGDLKLLGRYRLSDHWKGFPGLRVLPISDAANKETKLLALTNSFVVLGYRRATAE
jgi:hypothetical protein